MGAVTPFVAQSPLRLLVVVGVLGGFTTYSAYSLELVQLLQRGAYATAAQYVSLTHLFAVGGCFLGLLLGRAVAAPSG
jgi:CrcB protein